MNSFEQAGETMMLAEQGNTILTRVAITGLKRWIASFKSWLGNMPTTLPPTESIRR